jgi:hypothetical protein
MKIKTTIERGITKLGFEHEKGKFTLVHPPVKGTYKQIAKAILDSGESLQTGYELSILTKSAYENLNEPEFQNVKEIIKNNFLWNHQVTFWTPETNKHFGVYSVHDAKGLGRDMEFNQEELEDKLRGAEIHKEVRFNPDEGIAFAPRDTIYLGKIKDWNDFSKTGLVIANHMPKGGENLGDVGKEHFRYGYTWGVTGNTDIEKRVSALNDDWYGDWLNVVGNGFDDDNHGHAFEVFERSEKK